MLYLETTTALSNTVPFECPCFSLSLSTLYSESELKPPSSINLSCSPNSAMFLGSGPPNVSRILPRPLYAANNNYTLRTNPAAGHMQQALGLVEYSTQGRLSSVTRKCIRMPCNSFVEQYNRVRYLSSSLSSSLLRSRDTCVRERSIYIDTIKLIFRPYRNIMMQGY
jgi:hypothetical protein